jgi:hypothetical protein
LDLQSCFDMFDRCCYERDCGSSHYTCQCVTDCRQFMDSGVRGGQVPLCEGGGGRGNAMRVEEGLVQDSAVEGEGPEHDTVHEHPSYKWRSSSFV